MNCNKHKFQNGIALKDLIRTISCIPSEGIDIWRGCQWINVKKCSICGYSVETQNKNSIFAAPIGYRGRVARPRSAKPLTSVRI